MYDVTTDFHFNKCCSFELFYSWNNHEKQCFAVSKKYAVAHD